MVSISSTRIFCALLLLALIGCDWIDGLWGKPKLPAPPVPAPVLGDPFADPFSPNATDPEGHSSADALAADPFGGISIYPSSKKLPENHLRFYLSFPVPMSRGAVHDYVRLTDDSGMEIEDAFLELGEELWDSRQERLTLLIDPGRIKRGLKPREESGQVLKKGQRYTLIVSEDWLAADGKWRVPGTYKEYLIVEPDYTQPDPAKWTIGRVEAESTKPLEVVFGEPLDSALLRRMIRVETLSGHKLPGKIRLDDDETTWLFTPDNPWQPGKYKLVIDTALEDLAGNSIAKPFEVDLFEKVDDAPPVPKFVELEFEVK